jgi:hypothetical protein
MRRLVGIALLAGLVFLSALNVYADEEDKDRPKTTTIDSSKLNADEFVGILKTVPGTDRMFTLEVQSVKYVPAGKVRPISPLLLKHSGAVARGYNNAVNNYAKVVSQVAKAQAQVASARSLKSRQSAQNKLNNLTGTFNNAIARLQRATLAAEAQLIREGIAIEKAMPGLKPVATRKTLEFQAMETVKVRTMVLPEQFDDKGEKKKYTKEELAELKGKDRNLPGYESSLEKLEAGQKLRVVQVPAKKKPADKDKEDADLDKDPKEVEKTKQAKMIVILAEAGSSTPSGKKNK